MQTDALYYGDCLEVMRKFAPCCVDLIYLDPPFNSKTNYNILFGTKKAGKKKDDLAQLTAFTDTWEWNEAAQERVDNIMRAVKHPAYLSISGFYQMRPDGNGMLSYLSYMAERLAEMKRLLKPTGSIYLHCDPTASHYLKIIMDDIFGDGKKNYRNEIVWCYSGGGIPKKDYPRKHDIIFRYSKTRDVVFNVAYRPYGEHNTTGQRATDNDGTRSVDYNPEGTPITDWWTDIKPLINWG